MKYFTIENDTASYIDDDSGKKHLFFIINKKFYGDSLYIESLGGIKNSYISLSKIYYDLELNDSLYKFDVHTKDYRDTFGNYKSKIRISEFVFSRKFGFYMISYNCLNDRTCFTEYYYPESCWKIKKSRKRKHKHMLRTNNISDNEKRSKVRSRLYHRELKKLRK